MSPALVGTRVMTAAERHGPCVIVTLPWARFGLPPAFDGRGEGTFGIPICSDSWHGLPAAPSPSTAVPCSLLSSAAAGGARSGDRAARSKDLAEQGVQPGATERAVTL
jgi:hypothetical protein